MKSALRTTNNYLKNASLIVRHTLLPTGYYLLPAFLCLLPFLARAQWENRIIKKYSIREGLSQAVVNSIAQDDKGLMWFATDDGFNRFDGYSFTTFIFDNDSVNRPHDNFVQNIYRDSKGLLWVSSRRGLYTFNLSNQRLTPHLISDVHPAANDVSYITEGSQGNLWIACYGGGFALLDKSSKSFTHYLLQEFPELSSNASIVLYEDSYGLLWLGTQDKGLNVFKIKNEKVHEKRDDLSVNELLPSSYVKCLAEDHLGNMWIGTTKGLVLFIRKENRFHVFKYPDTMTDGKGVFALHQDTNKNLWIGTQGGGLHVISLKDFDGRHIDKLTSRHIEVLGQYNLSQHTIRSIFEDKDKNIWIGTHGDGIYMIGSEEKKFVTIQTKKFVKSAESFVPYYGMCNDEEGNIWVGTDGAGILKLNRNGEVLKQYVADGKPGSIKDNVIVTAFSDHGDNLWFGSYTQGLFLYDRGKDTFVHFPHDPADAPVPLGNQVRMIFEDSKRNLWIGATRGGLCTVDKKGKTFRYFPGSPAFKFIDVRAMVEDKSGLLWIGCYGNGLNYIKPDTGEMINVFNAIDEGNPLKSNVVYALALDKKNRLWIGTGGGGLSVYNIFEKTLKRYTDKEGLINNTIYALVIDDNGDVWASTTKGISKFNPELEHFHNYNAFDGLQEGQFNPNSFLYNLQEGYVCFGGSLGLNKFYPQKITSDSRVPQVMLSGFQLFNKAIRVGQNNNDDFVLENVIDETEEITLKHDQSVFTLEFVGLSYSAPEKIQYAYMLEGLDHDWSYVGNHRSATYRYLPAGKYVFKVKATSQENVWPDTYTPIGLVILPPFWKTPLAYTLYFVAMVLLAYGAMVVRKKQAYLRKRLRIEKSQRKRERQLVQEKLSFFTEVSHEFRTPLTLMIGPLEEMLTREGNFTPLGRKLKMVYKNAHKLLNLINKLLDYRKVETGHMVLKVKEDNIVAFVEELYITFKELALRKNLRFHFYPEQPAILTWFDKEKLEMVLNNILSNSFKYIGNGNEISITIRKETGPAQHEKVAIAIKDNGMGIPADQLKYIFDWFYKGNHSNPVGSGIGLALAKKLTYLHKGEIGVESTEGQGSVFTVKIPLGKEHFQPHEIVIDDAHEALLPVVNDAIPDDEPDEGPYSFKKGQKTVLIVEDEEDIRLFLRQYFESHYKILEGENGKHGIDIAMANNPDLIISDIMMPEMNGIDFCKHLKSNLKTSHIPVVLLTAKTSFSHHKEGLEIGADAYITKPFSPDMLALTIQNLLQSRENLKRFYRNLFISNGNGTVKKELVSPDEKFLQKIYELLKSNLDNPNLNLSEFSDELNISRSLLYKKIKTLTGLSPVEYIRSLRMQEAAQLLKSQQYKVFEVVYMVGFSDLKYFRQCFVKEFGYTPSELIETA